MPKKFTPTKQPDPAMAGPLPTLNSARMVQNDQDQRVTQVRANRLNQAITAARGLVENLGITRNIGGTDLIRTEFLRFLLDGPRDIDAECGYPTILTPDHYRAMYDREGIGFRVVNVEPEETWAMDPEVFEAEDEGDDTKFEKAWKKTLKDFNVWHFLQRIDTISGIGQFGVVLLGINDGLNLNQPVEGSHDDGTWDEDAAEHKLNFIRVFDETVIFVKIRETDVNNPRYGLPRMYTVQFRDFPNWGVQAGEIIARDIHWSRIIHIADNRKMSEVYGIPRMQQVWNRLYDLRKVYSSSGEAFWKGAFPALAFEVNPELADQDPTVDQESMKKTMSEFSNGLQRWFATTGLSVKTLPPSLVDPTGSVEVLLKAIAITKGIPYRILFGSEEAKLAGSQDSRAWNKRLAKRQSKYVSPLVIRPFIDRLIDMGILPRPEEYFIEWPDLNAPADQDKAQVSLTRAQALQVYVTSGASQLVPPLEFLTLVMGYSTEEAEQIMDASGGGEENDEDEFGEEEDNTGEGGLGGETAPETGNALDQQNLGRGTTAPGKIKQADPTFVQMPALNQEVLKILTPTQRNILEKMAGQFVANNGGTVEPIKVNGAKRDNGKANGKKKGAIK